MVAGKGTKFCKVCHKLKKARVINGKLETPSQVYKLSTCLSPECLGSCVGSKTYEKGHKDKRRDDWEINLDNFYLGRI